jgi:ribosomal protein S18 acetylase RimI-like enzyme
MDDTLKIGVIGDFDGRPSHIATNEAIRHCARHLGLQQKTQWIATDSLEDISSLNEFDALWCAPGSPYKSAQGAMNAIQFARENNYPFIGTCGGFQHVVIEFARDVLEIEEIGQAEFDPYAPNPYISALNCSLAGETRTIYFTKGTRVAREYNIESSDERYNCNFELNDQFKDQMLDYGFAVAGTDENGKIRILELPRNQFFVATLFQPQLSSTSEHPHKLILAYIKSAEEFRKRRVQISKMQLDYNRATKTDADLLINIYNAAFHDDYIRYGECPAYGRTRERMEQSIEKFPKYIVNCDGIPAGVISFDNRGNGEYYLGCLCVIPEYQGKGIGTKSFQYMLSVCSDWKRITLVTPSDKEENIRFYTEKCGFDLGKKEMHGNVEIVNFYMER